MTKRDGTKMGGPTPWKYRGKIGGFIINANIGYSMGEKIPIELTSMVGDFKGVTDVKRGKKNPDGNDHYYLIVDELWLMGFNYLVEHNYEVIGFDSPTVDNNINRIWIKKIE